MRSTTTAVGSRGALVLCLLLGAAAPSRADGVTPGKPDHNQRSMQMSKANELVVSYLAAWNERNAKHRRELVMKTWSNGGSYTDAHRSGVGHDAIDAMIKVAQDAFPGYQLHLVSGIEAHNSFIRFSWAAGGSADAPLYLAGTDFAVIGDDGRLKSVTGFVDAAPAH